VDRDENRHTFLKLDFITLRNTALKSGRALRHVKASQHVENYSKQFGKVSQGAEEMCHRRNGNLSKDGKEEKLFEEWGLILETEGRRDAGMDRDTMGRFSGSVITTKQGQPIRTIDDVISSSRPGTLM